ncbi:ABC transporter ATP-binding protein [Methylohalobius crimeensis]|uniref:ABC transporter ATP-binding protein n=1 Tax=Methylohalobius crimeensis TaxID=244365 RepID=UPI00047DE07B|nr:ABC transporter ATP-binding protein [Methylohalobius crimeensis]
MTALRLQNVRKVYDNGLEALRGIDLTVEEGDFFALLGPNGAGKSTTIGIITSLINKSSGKVSICGHDLDRDWRAARRCIGLVPQEINFNQFEKVGQIVLNQAGYYGVPRRRAKERLKTVLEQLDLWDRRNQVSRRLSGGMKRRLMIARALIHSPRLLILDEPTAGVDIEIRRSMWTFLRRLNREGTTIILTTHYLEEAEQLCRNVAIIDHGRIIESTSMEALLDKLDFNTFYLDLRYPVAHLPEISGFRLQRVDNRTWSVEVPRAMGLNPLFEGLTASGIDVIGLRPQEGRLEKLFFERVQAGRIPREAA